MARTTRSGAVFSPFHELKIDCSLEALVKSAVECEAEREEEDHDDAEGWPLGYACCSSPLTSVPSSPASSRPTSPSPASSRPPSPSLAYAEIRCRSPSPAACASSAPPVERRLTHAQIGHRKRRQAKRAAAKMDRSTKKIRPSQSKHYQELTVVKTSFAVRKLPVTRAAFIGKRFEVNAVHKSLQEYLDEGFKVVEWDGRTTLGLTDTDNRVFGVFVGPPVGDKTWPTVVEGARDRRGTFKTVATGLSYGGGQMKPGILRHTKTNTKTLQNLMENPSIKRILGFGNGIFKFYFPRMYKEYEDNMDSLLEHHSEFNPPIPDTVFAAASFNFGPDVVTYEHTDSGNKANGLCPIFCSGNFDPRKGGHLVLRQLKLLIQFPPGSLALIPSATLMHGNVPIQPGERRESFTQYAAGGLFRWVNYGFRSWKSLSADPISLEKEMKQRQTRWKDAIAKFSFSTSLHSDRMGLYG